MVPLFWVGGNCQNEFGCCRACFSPSFSYISRVIYPTRRTPLQIDLFSLYFFVFPTKVPRELDPLSFHKQFSRVLSHDLYWENKTYKLKRSVVRVFPNFSPILIPSQKPSPKLEFSILAGGCGVWSGLINWAVKSRPICWVHLNPWKAWNIE